MIEACAEMEKLRGLLRERGIQWEERSSDGEFWIERIFLCFEGNPYSVVHGIYTEGGVKPFLTGEFRDLGLLEVWNYTDEDARGCLTAEECLEYIGIGSRD